MSFNSKNQLKMDDFIKNTYKFGEICEVLNGRAYKKNELLESGKYTVLRVGNFFSSDNWYYSDLELDANKYCDNGDLLFAWSASFGPKIWDGGKVIYHYHIWKLVPSPFVDKKFLYYWLLFSRNKMLMGVHGSVMGHLTKSSFEKQKISLPDILEQKAIAHILSTLDDKIEVNNQINKTLENMAQAIFKQWFVDFEFPNEDGEPYKSSGGEMVESELGMIPKEWEVKVLGEIIDIIKQGTKPGEHLKDRKYNPIDTLPMKSIAINDFKPYEEAKSSLILFEKYDILIGAMRVYFHRVNLAPYKGITRTTTFVLRSKRIQDVPYNLFLLNMDETIDYAERTSKGSTMPYAVWDNGMSNILVAYSNQELRNKFFQIIQPMLETIMKKSAENEVLIKLRDSLLPKLMSGEIRVPLDEEGDAS